MNRYTFTTPDGKAHERLTNRFYTDVLVAKPSLEFTLMSAQFRDREVDSRNWAFKKAITETAPGERINYLGKLTIFPANEAMITEAQAFIAEYPTIDDYQQKSIDADMARITVLQEQGYFETYQVLGYHQSPTALSGQMLEARNSRLWTAVMAMTLGGGPVA